MKNYGTYNLHNNNVTFEANNGNTLNIETKHAKGDDWISIDEVEKLAHWAIKNGNPKGYNLLEIVTKSRIKYNCIKK